MVPEHETGADHPEAGPDAMAAPDRDWRWVGAHPDDRSAGASFRREVAALAREVMAATTGNVDRSLLPPPPPHALDIRSTTPFLLEEAARAARGHLIGAGTAGSGQVLLDVVRLGGCSSGRLRERSGLSPSTLSSILDRLRRDGLLDRRPNPGDGRGWLFEPTAAGRVEAERIAAVWRRADDAFLDGLTAGEREELRRLLRRSTLALVRRRSAG